MAKTSVPKSFNDLLKPEWKGQITIEGRAYEWFGTTLKAMGEEKGMAYMRELAKQTELRTGAICSLSSSPRESSKARSAVTRKPSRF